jgi:WD40 repeat protein
LQRATACAFGPIEKNFYTYAAATFNGEVHIWTLDPFTGVASATKAVASGSLRRSFTCLKFSPDGQWLYCGTSSGDVVTVNVARRSMQMSHPCCSSGVGSISFTLDYSKLIVGGGDGSLSLFANDNMWRDVAPFAKVPGHITSLTPVPDGSSLIIGTLHGGMHRLPAGTTASFPLRRSPTGAVRGLCVAPGDPSLLATCGDDGLVSTWTLALGPQNPPGLLLAQAKAADLKTHSAVQSVALTSTDIFSGWSDGSIRCHSRADPSATPWMIPNAHALSNSTGVTALKAAHRHNVIISGGAGGELRAWDTKNRTVISMMKKHTAPIVDLVVLQDDAHMVAGSQDKSWSLWDIKNGKVRASWTTNTVLTGLDVCPDQMTVVTVGQDRRIICRSWRIRWQCVPV